MGLVILTADPINPGHIRLIEEASRLVDSVVVGLLTDAALIGHRPLPYLNWEDRRSVIEALGHVSMVTPATSWDYSETIRAVKPNIFVHSNNWDFSMGQQVREQTIVALQQIGADFIEVDFTPGVSVQGKQYDNRLSTPEIRRRSLKRLLEVKPCLSIIEAHNPLSAILVDQVNREVGSSLENVNGVRFDGLWASSLTDSTARGYPDTESLSISERLQNVREIFSSTSLPLIFDADTGGETEHLVRHLDSMELLGVSAVIIEDKEGLKRNSLFGTKAGQVQASIQDFSEKIREAVSSRITNDFLLFSRIESLILEKGMKDALARAEAYVEAGSNGIMIHSRRKSVDEVAMFANEFRRANPQVPLVCVPTSFSSTTVVELEDLGFNVVIYANQLLRSSIRAMRNTASSISRHGRSLEIDGELEDIASTIGLIR